MMQAASHEDQVFKTGFHSHSSQSYVQKTTSCHHKHHQHHHHRLLKSSQALGSTVLTSNPTASPQIVVSTLPHIVENTEQESICIKASREPKCSTIGESKPSDVEGSGSLHLNARLRKDRGQNSSKSIPSSIPQPVIVRTYTPAESRTSSLTQLSSPPPLAPTPGLFSSTSLLNLISTLSFLRGRASAPSSSLRPPSASTPSSGQPKTRERPQEQLLSSPAAAAIRFAMTENSRLPSVDAFTFKNILRAIEPEIQPALDAIAEICSRSKLSLADEYSAHLPPLGEISAFRYSTHSYRGSISNGTGNTSGAVGGPDSMLPVVPEASSSSERLASQEQYDSNSADNHCDLDEEGNKDKRDSMNAPSPTEPDNGNYMPLHTTSEQEKGNDSNADVSMGDSNFVQSVAPGSRGIDERYKRRSSIILLSSSSSEGACPTAPTTTAIAGTVLQPDDAAAFSRSLVVASDDITPSRKPFRSNLASWILWGPSSQKLESQNQVQEDERRAEARLNNILRGAGTATKSSEFSKR